MFIAVWTLLALMASQPGDDNSLDTHKWELFQPAVAKDSKPFVAEDYVAKLNSQVADEYVLGPGDVVNIQVWQQLEMSGTRTLGPDGVITLPLVGNVTLGNQPRSKAQEQMTEAVARFYKNPAVTLEVSEYHNNNVYVLGQLSNPGKMPITGKGTLLEALTQIPTQMGVDTSLTKCALIRGRSTIVWVDLREMLREGHLGLDLKITNNDIIYLPQDEEPMVYVMGEVSRPGAYRLKSGMSFLDGLMQAGGPTLAGRKNNVELIRSKDGSSQRMRLKARELRNGDFTANVALVENDVIYVGRRPLAQINYFFSSISPFSSLLVIEELIQGKTN